MNLACIFCEQWSTGKKHKLYWCSEACFAESVKGAWSHLPEGPAALGEPIRLGIRRPRARPSPVLRMFGNRCWNRGINHPCVKVTEADVRAIRALDGILPIRRIAAQYGISHSTTWQIISRKTWGWLDADAA